jgi:serine/threonine protein kinase/tetratricopeptide (TPR) repeat protein
VLTDRGDENRFIRAGATIPGTKYVVEDMLGAGVHGVVYLAKRRAAGSGGTRFVVKVLDARFPAREVPRVDHPGVSVVVDAGTTDEAAPRAYYVREDVEGISLRRARLGARAALTVATEVAEALAAVHGRGVAHGRVKPGNVWLARQEDGGFRALLLDLGVPEAATTAEADVAGLLALLRGYEEIEAAARGAKSATAVAAALRSRLGAGDADDVISFEQIASMPDEPQTIADVGLGDALAHTAPVAINTTMKGVEVPVVEGRTLERATGPLDDIDRAAPTHTLDPTLKPRPEDGTLPPGTRVGRYVTRRQVGSGGMGTVYAAHDPDLAREVAIKLMRAKGTASKAQQLADRMQREAQAMARLSHPNVITVHDVGAHEGHVFVAMELVDGGTLRQWLTKEPRTTREILDVFVQAGRGLAAAHTAGLVHRDFKPDNVLVGKDGAVRVTDFGLARAVREGGEDGGGALADGESGSRLDKPLTQAGVIMGTPAYMAPEQMEGKPADARADIFAFCVSLWEALYGRRPFTGESLEELRTAIMAGAERPTARHSAGRVPPRVHRAIDAGLRANAAGRPSSMDAILSALSAGSRRRATFALMVATVAFVLAAITSAALFAVQPRVERPSRIYAEGRPRPSVAVLPFVASNPDGQQLATILAEVLHDDLEEGGRGFRGIDNDRALQSVTGLGAVATWPMAPGIIDSLKSQLGADYLAMGTIVTDGHELSVTAWLIDTTHRSIVGVYKEHLTRERVVDLALGLGDSMRRRVGALPVTEDETSSLRARVPRNEQARASYARALDLRRAFHYREARQLLEEAISIEPAFVFGHVTLSSVLYSMGFGTESREQAQTAFELSDGLARTERLRIEVAYRIRARDWDRALEVARALYTFYSDDIECGLLLEMVEQLGGSVDAALVTIDALRALPPPLCDDPRIDLREGEAAFLSSDQQRAKMAFAEAKRKADSNRDTRTQAQAIAETAMVIHQEGDEDGAVRTATAAVGLAKAAGDRSVEADALQTLGNAFKALGRWDDAQNAYEQSFQINTEIGAEKLIPMSLGGLAEVAEDRDDLRNAERLYNETRERAESAGMLRDILIARTNRAAALFELGELQVAMQELDAALEGWRATGQSYPIALTLDDRAAALLEAGQLESAERDAREAIDLLVAKKLRKPTAARRLLLVQILLAERRVTDAIDAATAAARDLDATPDAPEVALAHARRSVALLAARQREAALAEARLARTKLLPDASVEKRGQTMIASARVLGELGTADERAAAHADLSQLIAQVTLSGHVSLELPARLAALHMEAANGGRTDAVRALADALAADAERSGFLRIAREARTLAH